MPSDETDYILYGNVAVADVPVGVYQYKIVKTYPNGRVVSVEDSAAVTSVDDNGIAIFDSASTLAKNDKFLANWIINEPNAEFVKGTFKYEFTFGTTTKVYTVNIIDRPQLIIESVMIGSSETVLYDGRFIAKAPANGSELGTTGLAVTMKFDFLGIDDSYFYTIKAGLANDGTLILRNFYGLQSNGDVVNNDTSAEQSFKDLLTISLGNFTDNGTAEPTSGNRITYTIKLFKKLDYSELSTRYEQVGEDLLVVVGYQDLAA
jgi:hypothetical protein